MAQSMTMKELSALYSLDARRLRDRTGQLRGQLAQTPDPQLARQLARRILMLADLQREMQTMARLTRDYYRPDGPG